MDLKRGDTQVFYVTVPKSIATDGTVMYFMAKIKPDDDKNDSSALISKSSSDKSDIGDNVRFRFELTRTIPIRLILPTKASLNLQVNLRLELQTVKFIQYLGKINISKSKYTQTSVEEEHYERFN